MDVPGAVQSVLGDEQVAARVNIGGEDELFVTPTRTLIYNGEGLLSDESIEEFPHDSERITVSESRRKTTVALEYPIDGTREFSVPTDRLEDVLHPVVAGVLNAADVTEPGERVKETFRFSELTLVVTSERLVKHVGEAVWGDGHEEYHYGDVTDLSFEEGSVATQVVIEVDNRPQRIKAPNEQAEKVRQTLEDALLAYHDVGSLPELRRALGADDADDADDEDDADADPIAFGDGVEPLSTGPPESGGGAAGLAAGDDARTADITDADAGGGGDAIADVGAGVDPIADLDTDEDAADAEVGAPGDDPAVDEELSALREAVEEQNQRLAEHQKVLKRLIDRLSRDP